MPVRLKEGFAFNSQDAVASYEGAGYLTIESGARITCQFRADQDGNGIVQLLCHRILPNDFAFHLLALLDTGGSAGFRGTTAAGLTVVMEAERGGRPLSLDSDGYGSMFFVPGKIAVFNKEPPTNSHRFLLTNFAFSPFTHLGEPPHHPPPHRMPLTIDDQSVDVEITPLPDYVQRIVTLWQTRGIVPTCELHIATPPGAPKEWPFDLAVRICKLMSVAAGTVIEWIVATGFNAQGDHTRTVHAARRTKPYCSLAVAPIKEFGYEANTRMLHEFLQHGLAQFKSRDWRKMNGLLAAFLDARLENDYAEARGIKTVVVLEMLKDLFVDEYSEKVWEPMLPQALRRKIGTVIKTALKESDIPTEAVDAVRDKLGRWDPSFRRVLLYMIEQLGLVEDEARVKAIVTSRNSLVHTGQYVSVKDPSKGKNLGFADAAHEFFTLLSFVDRILLRIVGHTGMYTNYSECSMSRFAPVIESLPTR
jgi:hypothetical protein